MYTTLARLYDRFMDDVDYAAWARYYLQLLPGCSEVCECACGTGALTEQLARSVRVTASDISEDMLEVARERLRRAGLQVPLVCEDMCRLSLPHPTDAVLACCDGVNYCADEGAALAFFKAAFDALREGGILAFDVSTDTKCRAMNGQTWCDEREDTACIWHTSYSAPLLTMDVSIYLRGEDGRFDRFEEQHIQRTFSTDELKGLLEQAGFNDIRFYGDRTPDTPAPDAERIHCTAVRTLPRPKKTILLP